MHNACALDLFGKSVETNCISWIHLQGLFSEIFQTILLERFRRSLSACLAESDTQADEIDSIGRGHHEPVCGTRKFDRMVPSAPAEYLEFAKRRPGWIRDLGVRVIGEPIAAPFPNVAVHVIQSPCIGALLSHGMGGGIA